MSDDESCESLLDSEKWHTFLLNFLHSYTKSRTNIDVQGTPDKEICSSLKDMSTWTYYKKDDTRRVGSQYEKIELPCNVTVDDKCPVDFLKLFNETEFQYVTNIVNNVDVKSEVLNHEFEENLGILIVKGENINYTKIVTEAFDGRTDISFIYMFALNSVYIDKLPNILHLRNVSFITPMILSLIKEEEEPNIKDIEMLPANQITITEESILVNEVMLAISFTELFDSSTGLLDNMQAYQAVTLYLDYIEEHLNDAIRKNHFKYFIEKIKTHRKFYYLYYTQIEQFIRNFQNLKKNPSIENEIYFLLLKRTSEFRVDNLNYHKIYKRYVKAYYIVYATLVNEITCEINNIQCDLQVNRENSLELIQVYLYQLRSINVKTYSESDINIHSHYIFRESITHVKTIWDTLENDVRRQYYDSITKYINVDTDIRSLFINDTVKLINEFQILEEKERDLIVKAASLNYKTQEEIVAEKDAKTKFLSEYLSLLDKVNNHSLDGLIKYEYYEAYSTAFSFLKASLLSRIQYLKNVISFNFESNLIIDVSQYLESLKKDLNTMYSQDGRINSVNQYRYNYGKKINNKIQEIYNLIKNNLISEFDKVAKSFSENFNSLMRDVDSYKKNETMQLEQLKEKEEELQKIFWTQMVCGAFRIIGSILSAFGPWFLIAGVALSYAATGVEMGVEHFLQTPDIHVSPLPASVGRSSQSGRRKREINEKSHFNSNQKHQELNGADADKVEILNNSDTRRKAKRSLDTESPDTESLDTESDASSSLVDKGKKYIETNIKAKTPGEVLKEVKEEATKMANKVKAYWSKNGEIDKMITYVETQLKQLEAFGNNIQEKVLPKMLKLTERLKNETAGMATLSKAALEVKHWYINGELDESKALLTSVTEGFKEKNDLTVCVDKLSKVMSTIVKMYEHVQNYQEHLMFANYVADLNLPFTDKVSLNDTGLSFQVNKLSRTLEKNIILQRYMVAKNAFKQFVFPVAEVYLKNRIPQDKLELTQDRLLEQATDEINDFSLALNSYKKSIQVQDQYFGIGEFSSDFRSTKPFYVWKNKKYGLEISKLLSGEDAYFDADIADYEPMVDAIKFNKIEFKLITRNSTEQMVLDDLLKSFQIMATHNGESHYRYNDTTYVIQTNVEKIWYNFETSPKSLEPVRASSSYYKIRKGDFMLSPYAQWKLKIKDVERNVSFSDLQVFKNKIDIELRGCGFYVDIEKARDEDFKVNEHYLNLQHYKQHTKRSISDNYKTNSATPCIFSPINYICSAIKDTVMNLTPIKQIKQLLNFQAPNQKYDILLSNDFNNIINEDVIDYLNNDKVFSKEIENVPSIFINGESSQSPELQIAPFDFLNNQNLALLNFAVHKFNNVKYDQKIVIDNMMRNEMTSEYGQKLAYFAQISKIIG